MSAIPPLSAIPFLPTTNPSTSTAYTFPSSSSSATQASSSEVSSIPECYQIFIQSFFGSEVSDANPVDWNRILPIKAIVQILIVNSLFTDILKPEHPGIKEALTLIENATNTDVFQALVIALHEFERNKNPGLLIKFCNTCCEKLNSIPNNKNPDVIIQLIITYLSIIEMVKDKDAQSLMNKNFLQIFKKPIPNSPDSLFLFAVNSYSHLTEALDCFSTLLTYSSKHYNSETEKIFNKTGIKHQSNTNQLLLRKIPPELATFVRRHQTNINSVYKISNANLQELINRIHICFKNLFLNEYSKKSFDIIAFDTKKRDRQYVRDNCEIYENFLPRVKEHKEYLYQLLNSLNKVLNILYNFNFYINCGDIENLKNRFETTKKSTKNSFSNFQAILVDEIDKFSKQKNQEPFMSEILHLIGLDEFRPLRKQMLLTSNTINLCQVRITDMEQLLEGPLQLAEEYSQYLREYFPSKSSDETVSKKPKEKKQLNSILNNTVSSINTTDVANESNVSELKNSDLFPSSSSVSSSTIVAENENLELLPVLLNCLKNKMHDYFTSLSKNYHNFQTSEALKNAEAHVILLIRIVNRFSNKAKNPMKRAEIFSLIADCVHHGNLAVEQMLSALDRQSNRLSTKEELQNHLSHDLNQILLNCNNYNPHPKVCEWITQINRGELFAREVAIQSVPIHSLTPTNSNFVQRLLIKAWQYSIDDETSSLDDIDNETYSLDDIAKDIGSYMEGLGTLCAGIHDPLERAKSQTNEVDTTNAPAAESNFINVSNKLATEVRGIKIQDSPSSSTSKSAVLETVENIRSKLDALLTSTQSECIVMSLNNILNNLIVRLECELQMHENLQPAEAFLHFSNVLLLEQLIAEQLLQSLIDEQTLDPEKKISHHDLHAMVNALNIKEKLFCVEESNFLKRGKNVLNLIRYPANNLSNNSSHNSSHRAEDPLTKLLKDSLNHSIDLMISEPSSGAGFVHSGKRNKSGHPDKVVENVKKFVKTDLNALLGVLGKILNTTNPSLKN